MGKLPDERPPKADIVDQVQGDGFRLLLLVSADRLTASVQIVRSAPTLLHAGYQTNVDQQLEKPRKALAQAVILVKNLESALGQWVEQPGTSIRFPAQRKTQMIQLQSRLTDARLAARRAHAELLAQMHGAAPVGANIASAKQVFPRVTLVIDSVCEEEVATEVTGPVRLALDREQLTIKAVSGQRASAK